MQRLPVRIALDPRELASHPLQIGLSVKVWVDLRGSGVAAPRLARDSRTAVFENEEGNIDALIDEIIADNDAGDSGTRP